MSLKLWQYDELVKLTNKYNLTTEEHTALIALFERVQQDGLDEGLDWNMDKLAQIRAIVND